VKIIKVTILYSSDSKLQLSTHKKCIHILLRWWRP